MYPPRNVGLSCTTVRRSVVYARRDLATLVHCTPACLELPPVCTRLPRVKRLYRCCFDATDPDEFSWIVVDSMTVSTAVVSGRGRLARRRPRSSGAARDQKAIRRDAGTRRGANPSHVQYVDKTSGDKNRGNPLQRRGRIRGSAWLARGNDRCGVSSHCRSV